MTCETMFEVECKTTSVTVFGVTCMRVSEAETTRLFQMSLEELELRQWDA